MPCMMLADGTLGQMMEPVSLDMGEMKTHEKPWGALRGPKARLPHNIVNSLALDPPAVRGLERRPL